MLAFNRPASLSKEFFLLETIQQLGKKKKIGDETKKSSLSGDDMILCVETPKISTKKPTRTSKSNKVAGYRNQHTKISSYVIDNYF